MWCNVAFYEIQLSFCILYSQNMRAKNKAVCVAARASRKHARRKCRETCTRRCACVTHHGVEHLLRAREHKHQLSPSAPPSGTTLIVNASQLAATVGRHGEPERGRGGVRRMMHRRGWPSRNSRRHIVACGARGLRVRGCDRLLTLRPRWAEANRHSADNFRKSWGRHMSGTSIGKILDSGKNSVFRIADPENGSPSDEAGTSKIRK